MRPINEKISFIKRMFKGGSVARDGVNIAVKCPNRKCSSSLQDKRKLSIRLDTDQAQCWVCGLKSHSSLVPILRTFCAQEHIHEYIEKYLPQQRRKSFNQEEAGECEIEQIIDFPDDFKLLALNSKSRDTNIFDTKRYLRKRGLTERDFWYYKLGTSKDPKFHRRIIIPSFDEDGYVNFYTARGIDKRSWPPYTLPPANKLAIIFNECTIDWKEELTIVEGPFDLMKCNDNSTCLLGSGLTEDYILFWKIVKNKTPILLAMDKDAKRKTHKFAKLLCDYDISVRVIDLGEFDDVGEMSKKDFNVARSNAKSWSRTDALRDKIARLSSSACF